MPATYLRTKDVKSLKAGYSPLILGHRHSGAVRLLVKSFANAEKRVDSDSSN